MINVVIGRLIWDEWNVEHIGRHSVIPSEVEEVFRDTYTAYESHDGRFEVIGATKQKRILCIVLDPEPIEGDYYVVTAHTASRKDRALFQTFKGGDINDTTEK